MKRIKNLFFRLKLLIKFIFRKLGFIEKNQYESITSLYTSLLDQITRSEPQELLSVVFSKDRAMQLHAFLRSYFLNINNPCRIIVLYKVSTEQHRRSYDDLIRIFRDENIQFIDEMDFRRQLIECIESSNANNVLFWVDDMIITRKFDFDLLKAVDTNRYIVSLTRGSDLTYSTVLLKDLTPPVFTDKYGMKCFKWNASKIFSDWTYPLGVSGYMYGKQEIMAMLNILNFKAPNSLESSMQTFYKLFLTRFGLCTNECIAICVHANIVQTEGYNPILGTFSTDELLKLWNENKQIDISIFFHKSAVEGSLLKYTFENRDV